MTQWGLSYFGHIIREESLEKTMIVEKVVDSRKEKKSQHEMGGLNQGSHWPQFANLSKPVNNSMFLRSFTDRVTMSQK